MLARLKVIELASISKSHSIYGQWSFSELLNNDTNPT